MPQFNDPRNYNMNGTETCTGAGLCLRVNSGALETTDNASSHVCVAVSADESSRGEDNALETSGQTVSAYPLGGVLMIQSAGVTWAIGDIAYATAGGQINKSSSSQKAVGIFVGTPGAVDAGTLVPIATSSGVVA